MFRIFQRVMFKTIMKLQKNQILLIVIWMTFMTLFCCNGNLLSGLIRSCISVEIGLLVIYFLELK